jgi:hypothetical protein
MTSEMLVDPGLPDAAEATFGNSPHAELVSCLDNFRQLSEEIASYEALCRASEAAEAEALANHSLPEEEAVELIAKAQARKHVHEARIAKKHEQLKVAHTKLESVLTAASGQLRGEYLAVLEATRRELAEVVLRVLEIPATPILPPGIGQAVGNSPRIRALEACRPMDANAIGHLPVEQRAADVLARFERLVEAKGETI